MRGPAQSRGRAVPRGSDPPSCDGVRGYTAARLGLGQGWPSWHPRPRLRVPRAQHPRSWTSRRRSWAALARHSEARKRGGHRGSGRARAPTARARPRWPTGFERRKPGPIQVPPRPSDRLPDAPQPPEVPQASHLGPGGYRFRWVAYRRRRAAVLSSLRRRLRLPWLRRPSAP